MGDGLRGDFSEEVNVFLRRDVLDCVFLFVGLSDLDAPLGRLGGLERLRDVVTAFL